ncbi:MAG: hypothetical protein AVDCRST_MAG19-3776 [uncultured Thermomicrobiales bacterium]|uniref:Uncharacterized protein n=1 Tax=uncultured Thermomicrobiales bacterium TaxID=1645740 RepID=A0A6J4VH87_9BACT|nr:MAG: hypothetical protein AVDCRST_MAG19-3776 [uncultured Thermomicrobiales bacterium]
MSGTRTVLWVRRATRQAADRCRGRRVRRPPSGARPTSGPDETGRAIGGAVPIGLPMPPRPGRVPIAAEGGTLGSGWRVGYPLPRGIKTPGRDRVLSFRDACGLARRRGGRRPRGARPCSQPHPLNTRGRPTTEGRRQR